MISDYFYIQSSKCILSVRHSGRTHTVADQDHAVCTHHLERCPHHRWVDMYTVTDNLCHYMFTVGHCSYNTRFAVCECRHRIKEMYGMICTCIECCFCMRIVRIGMCKRNIHFIFHFFHKCNRFFTFFRCKSDKFYQSLGCVKKSLASGRITRHDVSFILCTLFHRADEWTFHVHAYKIRSLWILFFFVFCRSP